MSNSVLPRILFGVAALGAAGAVALAAPALVAATADGGAIDQREVTTAGHSWGDAKPPQLILAGHSWGDAKPPTVTGELSPAGHSWGDSKPVETPALIPAGHSWGD